MARPVPERLTAHLRASLGAWPPPPGRVVVTTCDARTSPGWDGRIVPFSGVRTPDGGAVVSLDPSHVAKAEGLGETYARFAPRFEEQFDRRLVDVPFRWCEDAPPLEPVGSWIPVDDPVVPEWLHPFGGAVLVVLEDGRYVAGVGLKRHDEHAREISVGTEEAARGRGLARRLVATAARGILDDDMVPTYLHDVRNTASARVAEASGFPDRGWRLLAAVPR